MERERERERRTELPSSKKVGEEWMGENNVESAVVGCIGSSVGRVSFTVGAKRVDEIDGFYNVVLS